MATENLGLDSGKPPKIHVYKPITGSGTIRVLDLHKTQSGFLECSVTQISFEEGGYQALSYEWGSLEQPFGILVRGAKHEELGRISLTKNLFDALGDLHNCPDIQSKRFWIDQICINQADDEEKGHQVELMASIYRHASRVITYLGPQSENVERENGALELLDRIASLFESEFIEIARTFPNMAVTNPRLAPLIIRRGSKSLDLDNPHWIDLLRIVYSGWTHRLWMVQENILCHNTVMLRGRRLLHWISVASIPALFSMEMLPRKELRNDRLRSFVRKSVEELNQIDAAIAYTWALRQRRDSHNEYTPFIIQRKPVLDFNIFLFSCFECKDPRDRVYAILGISEDARKLGIVPNYELPESQVFIDMSVRFYLHRQKLRLLSNLSAFNNSPDQSLPSWAYRATSRSEDFTVASNPHPWDQGNIKFKAQNSIMVVKGQIVDIIQTAAPPLSFEKGSKEYFIIQARQMLLNCAMVLEHVGVSIGTLASLFHGLICDKSWPTAENDTEAAFYFWCLYFSFANHLAIENTTGNGPGLSTKVLVALKSTCELLRKEGRDVQADPYIAMDDRCQQISYQVWTRLVIPGRSFCISGQKKICNATGKVQTDDVIAILAGGRHGYLLRPVGENYQYVGTVWTGDLADGAAYKDVSPEEVDYEIQLV
ncbi:HET-domain-containing protein [Hyaloscypha variabilis F]|uniref:HET-domain-containing protein n=1 Tax=Hyaloscypha variabilis (strain UAMH 11265 / GT02V1 / F) TaxID=1149755 RepID=A0A2J6QXT6_HYAVF|nr:HET-domain-containing protein [Hyaloscypha variabilis F]